MPQSHEGTKIIIYFKFNVLRNQFFVSLCLGGNKKTFSEWTQL